MTTAQKYLKGAVAPGGRQFFFFNLCNSKYILSNRFGLERKIATLCFYRDSGRNSSDVTHCALSQ